MGIPMYVRLSRIPPVSKAIYRFALFLSFFTKYFLVRVFTKYSIYYNQ